MTARLLLAFLLVAFPAAAQEARGTVSKHSFITHVAKDLPGNEERYIVYTPPNYDAHKPGGYPVLYLLHGFLGDETGWGKRADVAAKLDSWIGSGKAVPMIVVMPLGYGDQKFLDAGLAIWRDHVAVANNRDLYSQMFETEIMPHVESEYNISKDRNMHAIAGLSMGGLETFDIGLNHPEQFAWVCGFSAAVKDFTNFPTAAPKQSYRLLWDSVGTDDQLIVANHVLVSKLLEDGYAVTAVEMPGAHEWSVWRHSFDLVVPMLFRDAAPVPALAPTDHLVTAAPPVAQGK